MTLRISEQLALPIEAVTATHGILAMRGAGKSNAGVVLAEEMYDAGLPWVAIDPKGDWWGIRSSQDGKNEGLSIPVLGGIHNDVLIGADEGRQWANVIVDNRLTCVVDVSEFSKGDQTKFLADFAERLFRAKAQATYPMHLFLEEADDYIPQKVYRDQARTVGAFSKIVKQGRARGLGATLITQRSAVLNKDVLTQLDTLIALRTTAPQDRKAILAWVEHHAIGRELVDSLPELDNGEAWLWSPYAYKVLERVRFRRRRTFDSGATPTIGKSDRPPVRLADIDLAAIKEQMAESIERAKADDPKELRKRIRDLERQLAERPIETETVEVEREVVPAALHDDLVDARRILSEGAARYEDAAVELRALVDRIADPERWKPTEVVGPIQGRTPDQMRAARAVAVQPARPTAPAPTRAASPPKPAASESHSDGEIRLGKAEVAMLSVLAQFPAGRTKRQLGALSGYSPKKSTFRGALAPLRAAGYVRDEGELIIATEHGLEAIAACYEPPPEGPELLDHWLGSLGQGEREVLKYLISVYPQEPTRDEIGEATGYDSSKSTFRGVMAKLRSIDLVEGLRVRDEFMEAIR